MRSAPAASPGLAAKRSTGPACAGLPATIVGTNKSETIRGTEADDVIVALGGNDKVLAGAGNDVVCTGRGNDVVKGGAGRDFVWGGPGKDKLVGQAGKDRLYGQGGPDRLVGGGDADYLDGGPARDVLVGGPSRDGCRGEKRRGCETKRTPNPHAVDLDAASWRGATLEVSGLSDPAGGVQIDGGLVPVTAAPDPLGRFSARVDVAPGTSTVRVVSAASGRRASLTVRRPDVANDGVLTGRVVDAVTKEAIAGAEVEVGGLTTTAADDGTFTIAAPADGLVLVHARAEGYLAGLAHAGMREGAGAVDGDLPLVGVADEQSIGPEGGTLTGDGWSLEVPAGAVAEPTGISVTPLPFTGTKDVAYGIPLFDVSPTGLTFAKPVTLSFEAPIPGVDDGLVDVLGLDPDTLAERHHDATLRDGVISVSLTSFQGEETRIRPTDQADPSWLGETASELWGGLDAFCTPFSSQTAAGLALAYVNDTIIPFIRVYIGSWNAALWMKYIGGGSTGIVRDLPLEPTYSFVDDSRFGTTVQQAVQRLLTNRVAEEWIGDGGPRALPSGESGSLEYTIKELDPGETYVENGREPLDLAPGFMVLDYEGTLTPPGNAAGGTGSYVVGDVEYPDEREVTGTLRLESDIDSRGVVRAADLVTEGLSYRVRDAIDFCPGNPGTGQEIAFTVPFSRLEVTPYGDTDQTFAAAVPFEVDVDLKDADFDGLKARVLPAHNNDEDKDGWPNFQPYVGADYELDNCVLEPNPRQQDSDDDGLGDACDPYTCDDITGRKAICKLPVLTSEWTRINASGAFGAKGSKVTAKLAPSVPACDKWPGRDNWSPTPCYYETDVFASGQCVYLDPETKEFKEIACSALYTEPPGWSTPPITEQADTYHYNQSGPVNSCGAAGNFWTYIYGGDARYEKWAQVGPTSLECRLRWEAERPDALPGKTFMQIYGTLRGPENPDDGYSKGFVARVSTWIPVRGTELSD
ncbi:hypothetical protein ISG29_00770 [Nocardioides sp. CBS4Y-1]|uniref:Calcium-binding protein n=1 Tax=Nocardioides acrostichi TaxID=2784339 RepID=A0A930Y4I0_9ACTN|nr:hypothetical protein [Nocardioides acrostichi]